MEGTEEDSLTVLCGTDRAERHHDVALVDDTGTLLAKTRISDDAAGYKKLLDLLPGHGDSPKSPIPVAIETSRGLLVAALRTGMHAHRPLPADSEPAQALHRPRASPAGRRLDTAADCRPGPVAAA